MKSIIKAKSPKKYMELCDKLGFTKQILPGFKVSKPYINENDYILFLAWILRKNDVSSLGKKLNSLKYSAKEWTNISFLNSLQNFKPENVYMVKKFQEKTSLTDRQIILFGKYIGKDLKKLVKFKLSVRGNEVPTDIKGPEIGKVIQKMEKEKFLSESFLHRPRIKKALNILVKKKVLPKNYALNINKLQSFLHNNPVVMTQLLKLLGENINEIAKRKTPKKFKDIYNARYRTYEKKN